MSFSHGNHLRSKWKISSGAERIFAVTHPLLSVGARGTNSCFSMTSVSDTEQSPSRETWALVSRSVKRSTRDAKHEAPRRQVRFYTTTNPPPWNPSPSQHLALFPPPWTLLQRAYLVLIYSNLCWRLFWCGRSLQRYWLTRLLANSQRALLENCKIFARNHISWLHV